MTEFLLSCVVLLVNLYGVYLAWIWFGWRKVKEPDVHRNTKFEVMVTVVVAARNEAGNLPRCINSLLKQEYPSALLECIIVDDHSDDETLRVANEKIAGHDGFKVMMLDNDGQGKKAALQMGISHASGQLIVTTDADCTHPARWIQMMVTTYLSEKAKMVLGPVALTGKGFFRQWQALEMRALMGLTGGAVGWGKPTMANGANLAFEKEAFFEVGGYEGNTQKASGDDVFLLHKMMTNYPDSIAFAKHTEAVVSTPALGNPGLFMDQRVRWASKMLGGYKSLHIQFAGALVYFLHLFMLICVILSITASDYMFWFRRVFVLKFLIDMMFLYLVDVQQNQAMEFRRGFPLKVLLGELLNLLYIPVSGLLVLKGSYRWKGRKVR
ncbi:MAG: glycosyltransferase [Flavobacteriales bacterium]|nr:glycosyltransferase [Flavobacteriales bacterium]